MTIPIWIHLPETPDPMELTLPGGVAIEHIDLAQIIQPALTPLVPLFNIVDTVVSIFNCLKAVMTLNPKEIGKSIPAVAENVGKLLKMIPQLSVPLMLIGLSDFAYASGGDLLKSKIIQVLATDGEMPWRTSFGSSLSGLRHQKINDVLVELVRVYVRDALKKWAPEVEVLDVLAKRQGEKLYLDVHYGAVG